MRFSTTLLLTPLLALAASAETLPTTYTITRTVERVVQTTWATSSLATATATWEAPKPSAYASAGSSLAYGNGTAPATGVYPSGSATGTVPVIAATGAASRFGVDVVGFAAVAGLVGMVAF